MSFRKFSFLFAASTVAAMPQLATSTAATTNSTEVTATSSMSFITAAPVVMKDIKGNNFTCFTEGDRCSRDAFGGVGDHLPANQSMDWTSYAIEALVATVILPTNVVTVTENCNAYSSNSIKCPPYDPKINPGTAETSVATTHPRPDFTVPGSCGTFLKWERAVQCQGVQISTTTSAPTATRTVRPQTDVSHFYLNVTSEFPSGNTAGYLAVQAIEGEQGFYNLTVVKDKPNGFNYFHFVADGRIRGLATNGIDHSSSYAELQWYIPRDANNWHDDDNDESRETWGPVPVKLAQESASFPRGSLGKGHEEVWGMIERDALWNETPVEKLKFDSKKEDKHPYKQPVIRNSTLHMATRRWTALYKGRNLPKEEMEGWELVVVGAIPKPKPQ